MRSLVLKFGRARIWFVLAGLAFFVLGFIAWRAFAHQNTERNHLVAREETVAAAPAFVTVPPIVITAPPIVITAPPVVITVIPPTPATPPIAVATTVAEGCCTIVVRVTEHDAIDDKDIPVPTGFFEVTTISGRPPEMTTGEFTDGLVQIPVGREWIGQIKVSKQRESDYCSLGNPKSTDLIGGPYGRKDRALYLGQCQ